MGVLHELYGWSPDTKTEKEKELDNRYYAKLDEYSEHFNGDDFTTEMLPMTKEEIIENIDKCIKYNRKWEGFIVPELDYDDVDI